jgi:hypothetical protein
MQIMQWGSTAGFRPEQFLVLTLAEIHGNKTAVLNKVAAFAGDLIPTGSAAFNVERPDEVVHEYARSRGSMDPALERELRAFYRPFNLDLMRLLRDTGIAHDPHFLQLEHGADGDGGVF